MLAKYIFRILEIAKQARILLASTLYYKSLARSWGSGTRIDTPLLVNNLHHFHFGKDVRIRRDARLEAVVERYGVSYSPRVEIGDGTTIEQGFHLACAQSIRIGRMVAITEYVAIFDIFHPYDDANTPIVRQQLRTAPVEIGDDCLIGYGVVIQPGVQIGKHCIIGANSVVTKNIPDFSVAVGSPAKVIRRYNSVSNAWESVAAGM